jgi:hypothetical protein
MTTTNQNASDILTNNFMLASFSSKMGAQSKTDKAATDEMLIGKGAKRGSAKAIKNLWAGADAEVKDIASVINKARGQFYSITQPFLGTDSRLLANAAFITEFMPFMTAVKVELAKALARFELVYTTRVQQALHNLGGLAQSSDYPTYDEFARGCSVSHRMSPVPSGVDWSRASLPSGVSDKLAEKTRQQTERACNEAIKSALVRMIKPLESLHKATSVQEEGRLRARPFAASIYTNLELVARNCSLFNIFNDPDITDMVEEVEQLLRYDIAELKGSESAKVVINEEVNDVLEKFADMGWAA